MPGICFKCVGDEALRAILKELPRKRSRCRYCGHRRIGVSLDTLAETVDEPIRMYCQIGAAWPGFSQEGESLDWLLQEELGVEPDVADDLVSLLIELDPAYPPDGDEPFYSDDQNYHRRYLPSITYSDSWQGFCDDIKHRRRFFDESAKERLGHILGQPGNSKAQSLPVTSIGPGTSVQSIFRARRAEFSQEARKILRDPTTKLGPPPVSKASAGRMNAQGISVFYGAFSPQTAIAEVRPPVGGLVVVGTFRPLRTLRLLDLSRIGIIFTGSIFAPEYEERVDRSAFLNDFHALIAKPVHPYDEPLEYIPTQAVAEYVSNILGLDGILYASAQTGAVPQEEDYTAHYITIQELSCDELAQHNVVLFEEAGSVCDDAAADDKAQLEDSVPGLAYHAKSAEAYMISSVEYTFEREYIGERAVDFRSGETDF